MWRGRLRLAELERLGHDVSVCASVMGRPIKCGQFLGGGIGGAAAVDGRMASGPSPASQQGVTYDFPDWEYCNVAPTAARRTDRHRGGWCHRGGAAVGSVGGRRV